MLRSTPNKKEMILLFADICVLCCFGIIGGELEKHLAVATCGRAVGLILAYGIARYVYDDFGIKFLIRGSGADLLRG